MTKVVIIMTMVVFPIKVFKASFRVYNNMNNYLKFGCVDCKYFTDSCTNIKKHLSTKRHLLKNGEFLHHKNDLDIACHEDRFKFFKYYSLTRIIFVSGN